MAVLTGCQSDKVTHYTAPEIIGQVLAADTRQPLANVNVQRDGPQNFQPFGPSKGGQQIIQPSPVKTDADGKFVLQARSVFALFRKPGWWSVPVTFQHAGYESFSTNYTGSNVTGQSAAGAPLVNAGVILLKPLAK
jgi:hypothetical protein